MVFGHNRSLSSWRGQEEFDLHIRRYAESKVSCPSRLSMLARNLYLLRDVAERGVRRQNEQARCSEALAAADTGYSDRVNRLGVDLTRGVVVPCATLSE